MELVAQLASVLAGSDQTRPKVGPRALLAPGKATLEY